MSQQHHHRSSLKQQNKPFKSRHSTKSAVKDRAKGRVQRTSLKSNPVNAAIAQTRLNRRNTAKQVQLRKRQALIAATRIFNGVDGAPRIVAVIPLCSDLFSRDAVEALGRALDVDTGTCPDTGLWRLKYALDACKAADYVVFTLSAVQEVDKWGDLLLRCLQAQGLPEVVTVVTPSHSEDTAQIQASLDRKARGPILKSLLSFIRYFVPTQSRVYDLEETRSADATSALRSLCEGKPHEVQWRQGRSWILAEDLQWDNTDSGTLKVSGIVRGTPLSVNRLVHIPNYGDFQQSKILSIPNTNKKSGGGSEGMELEPVLAASATDDADSLISVNDPDTLANEQTWPTDEEMNGVRDKEMTDGALPDAKVGTTPKAVKRVPKGTSQYQAAWIIDDEDDEEGDENEQDEEEQSRNDPGEEMEDLEMDAPSIHDATEMDESEMKNNVHFDDLDAEEEEKQLKDWRTREREAADEMLFPDEIDTPENVTARQRFQRYRGLRSFRTSPWDPYENLPVDYAKIFQFEDYHRTERVIRRKAEEEAENIVDPGTHVTVYLKNVPEDVIKTYNPNHPFIIFALFQHEHKMSVINFTVQRNTEYTLPVKSKDPMVLCVGPRRFRTNPIYSQHTRGGGKGANNVHKFERFLQPGVTCVATTFAPVIFGKQPCMLLKETADVQEPDLVAMGSFLNTDTTRIIAKRIVLTGHPFKVHKKTATVRYMFFNPDDISYFAPVQLHTKHGRSGHIRESLGTHGYFKAHFDGPVNQMDTICMSLYKRVYPKWATLFKPLEDNTSTRKEAVMEE
ncbi:hypothetical protein Clacol_000683 [Clathrus columnatus]|uniref:Bms1-type G domain-containing protein n=1 Tax=Clathrus columnatus TaxID=1419009 RepID=A0AAV5A0D8_9AGAM|nr:hypothetical protein Clacol_000683 [Clathrus columnatus]